MSKRFLRIIAVVLMVAIGCVAFVACSNDTQDGKENPIGGQGDGENAYEINASLVADSYADYETIVDIDTEKYPALSNQGLSIVTGYGENDYGNVYEVAADGIDSATGKSNIELYFDDALPSIIIVHGVMFNDGRNGERHMGAACRESEVSRRGEDYEGEIPYLADDANFDKYHELSKYWADGGNGKQAYNVFYFHYEHFADSLGAGEGDFVMDVKYPGLVVDRIWSNKNGVQAIYYDSVSNDYVMTEEGEALGGYSLSEYFAAEYLRAFNKVDELYPTYKTEGKRTYVASHSMGGVMTVASTMLIKLLSDDGQIDVALTPSRLIQMDSFIGMPGSESSEEISWSGEDYLSDENGSVNGCQNYLYSLEALALKYNVAVDFYMNEDYGVPFTCMAKWNYKTSKWTGTRSSEAKRVQAVAAMVLIHPYFAGVSGPVLGNGHNPIREWVLSSYLYDAPKTTVDGVEYVIPTAAMSNEDVIAARGTFYEMRTRRSDGEFITEKSSDGSYKLGALRTETVRCDDDMFDKLK